MARWAWCWVSMCWIACRAVRLMGGVFDLCIKEARAMWIWIRLNVMRFCNEILFGPKMHEEGININGHD